MTNPVYTASSPTNLSCPFHEKAVAGISQAAPGQRPAPANRLMSETPNTYSSAQSQCGGTVFGRSASHGSHKPTAGEPMGVFWDAVGHCHGVS